MPKLEFTCVIFPLLLIITLFILIHSKNSKYKLAICIGGQSTRWLPELLRDGLLLEQSNDIQMDLFFTIQQSKVAYFSSDPVKSFDPTYISSFDHKTAYTYLRHLLDTNISHVQYFELVEYKPRSYFENKLGALNRLRQYASSQEIILNMYSHQVNCIKKIKSYENENDIIYDFVISSREDAFYFSKLNISNLIIKYFSSIDSEECHIVSKDCMKWGGLNMRWQMMRRRNAFAFFGGRLDYYDSLYNKTLDRNVFFQNPEIFELRQLESLGLTPCITTFDDVPVVAARHITNGSFCLISTEYAFKKERCHPSNFFYETYACPKSLAHYHRNKNNIKIR